MLHNVGIEAVVSIRELVTSLSKFSPEFVSVVQLRNSCIKIGD